jgi:hypothetical protein
LKAADQFFLSKLGMNYYICSLDKLRV